MSTRTLAYHVTGIAFEGAVLVATLHAIYLFGPRGPLVLVVIGMGIGLVRSVSGLVASASGRPTAGPGGVFAPRGIPHDGSEKLPTLLVVGAFTFLALIALSVLGLPGVALERDLAAGTERADGVVVGARSQSERVQTLVYTFEPRGAEPVTGGALLVGPAHRLPKVDDVVEVRYLAENPDVNRMVPPEGLGTFPHGTVAIELALLTLFGWAYVVATVVQRPEPDAPGGLDGSGGPGDRA